MRKVLSLVLVLALVLGSFSMAFAATPKDVVGAPSEQAVTVLMDLGVVSGYTDGTYKPAGIVTRAEMAKLIVAALGLSNYATGTTTKFPDMAGATWAQGYVSYATGLGIVSGYPDGTFKPSQTVTYAEAASMIVRALGYTQKSLLPATWPANFVVKAKALGLFDDVKSAVGGANRGDIAMMLYNALDANIGTVDAENKWTASLPADTMLSRLGAEPKKDVTIYGDEPTMINLRALVGAEGTTYTKDDKIVAFIADSTFKTGTFDGDVFTSGGVDYSITTSLSALSVPFFDNGVQKSEIKLDSIAKDLTVKIAADFSGKKITKLYSISTWAVSDVAIATASDLEGITADKALLGFDFILDDNSKIDPFSYELVGVSSLANIKADNIVYVYVSGEKIRKVAVGTEVVKGLITKVQGDDYTINGKVYSEVDTANSEFVNVTPDITGGAGDKVTAYLDAYGNIFKMVADSAAENYAVVLETGDGTGASLTAVDPAIKLFLADGTNKTFKVDGSDVVKNTDSGEKAIFKATSLYTWDTSNVTAGAIVTYTVDKDGFINNIDLPHIDSATGTAITARGYFDGFEIAKNAVLFTFDGTADKTDESNYGVTTLAKVLDSKEVDANYVVNDARKIDAMLLNGITKVNEVYGVLTDFATTNTTAGYELTMLVNGVEKTYVSKINGSDYGSKEDFSKLYEISFNPAGEVTALNHEDPKFTLDGTVANFPISVNASILKGVVLNGSALTEFTLDSALVVYEWNYTDHVFKVATKRDIAGADLVQLFDLVDSDGVIDTVLVFDTGNSTL